MSTINGPDIQLNLNVRGLPLSATLAINESCARLQAEGRQIFRFGLGQSPFPVPQPVVDALKLNARQKDYLPVKGLPALRSAVSDYHRRTNGLECTNEDVLVAPGSKELMFLLQLVYYGDLLIPTPAWVSYAPQAHIIGRHVHWLPCSAKNNWRLVPEEIDRFCRSDTGRPRILVLNYPSNPTGSTYLPDELREIAEAARRQKILLLSDEIYGELHHRGEHISIARFYPEGTIVSGGLSKWCGAGGWRLGTFVFPRALRWLQDAMAVVASETYTSTSAPIQYAAVRAFEGGTAIENYLATSRRILRAIASYMVETLRDAGLSVIAPEGAFYLFPDFEAFREKLRDRGIETSIDLCQRLLDETGVAALPGASFGQPASYLTLRIAYVDFDGARAIAAAEECALVGTELSRSFIESHCTNLVNATLRLANWLQQL